MNIKKDEYERVILNAFAAGMSAGYGIEHTELQEQEEAAIKAYAESNGFKRKSLW